MIDLKNNHEKIKSIKKACELADETFYFIKNKLRAGQTEKQVAKIINGFIQKNGGKLVFRTIVSFGKNTANVHHKPTDKVLRIGQLIMLDLGAKVDGYCSDLTRMLFLKSTSPEFKKLYALVLKAQESAIEKIKKEKSAQKIDEAAREVINKNGYGKYFLHGLGHSLGLKIHENPHLNPKSKDILRIGDIVTIEPGIYIKGKGGVRIEDDVLVGRNNIEILTKSSKELKDIII